MRSVISKVPIPIAGVALGLAALGNLLQGYSAEVRWLCGGLSALLFALLVLKIILFPEMIRQDYRNSVLASVSATIFMTAMQLASYAAPFLGLGAKLLWFAAVVGHAALIVWFTFTYFRAFRLEQVFPTYFITYVGIVVASVTSAALDLTWLGRGIFWFGFAAYAVMFVLVTVRYRKLPIPEPSKPLFCIYAAPMSLSLAGYLTVMEHTSLVLVLLMEAAAQVLYLVVLTQLPKLLKLPFYPSYAAFTFPFVITAFALQKTVAYLEGLGWTIPGAVFILLAVETAVATLLVFYTVIRYGRFLLQGRRRTSPDAAEAEAA